MEIDQTELHNEYLQWKKPYSQEKTTNIAAWWPQDTCQHLEQAPRLMFDFDFDLKLNNKDKKNIKSDVEKMCQRLLTNPVIHDYEIEIIGD